MPTVAETTTPTTEELVRRLGEKTDALNKVNQDAARLQSEIAEIQKQLVSSTREKTRSLIQEGASNSAVDSQVGEQEEYELINNSAITLAIQVAQKVYGDRFEGKSFPSDPSATQVTQAFSREEQKKEIAGRTEPTLRFMVVEDGDTLRYRPVIIDGPQEMPLGTYEGRDVDGMTREERILASREVNENPDHRKELDHEDMTVYDLLSRGAATQGKPIDKVSWSMLTAKFKEGDRFVWDAGWGGGRPGRGRAGFVGRGGRLRFAVWGDVIS